MLELSIKLEQKVGPKNVGPKKVRAKKIRVQQNFESPKGESTTFGVQNFLDPKQVLVKQKLVH